MNNIGKLNTLNTILQVASIVVTLALGIVGTNLTTAMVHEEVIAQLGKIGK